MEKVRVQDDLYNFVNQEWEESAVIPDDKPVTGGFVDLADDVEKLLINDFKQMNKEGTSDILLARAAKLFAIANDGKRRNRMGIKPVVKYLSKFDKIKNLTVFNRNLKTLVIEGYPLPFSISVEPNMKDTLHHALSLGGPSVILPDTTYYKEGMEATKNQLLGLWSNMAKALLQKVGLADEVADLYVSDALKFDAIVATLVKSQEEWSEYTKTYNPMKLTRVCSLLKPVKFKKLLMDLYGKLPEEVIVAEPRFLKGFKTLFNEETFELYKHWAYIKIIIFASSYLSEELRELGSSYQRALYGIAKVSSLEKQAYQIASNFYSEPVGLYYGRKYFGDEAKKDVVDMVKLIIETYKKRVKENDFLAEATKQKAIVKLDKIVIKMGYPDECNPKYNELVFDESKSLFECLAQLSAIKTKQNLDELFVDVDRSEWVMPGHMVNACYNPFTNDITFPAAILQAPFYSIKQTRSQNLGGIGAVIGHEISHAFDNNGAKCDENGNLNNWWTKEDLKKFEGKTKAMIKEFEGIQLPWGEVNSKFIVSENIADNGGMAVALDIMGQMDEKDYKEFFYNWARVWRMKGKPEYLALLLKVDVHGPAILRANMQPRNFPEWYDTFGVTSKDKMYIKENKRVVIW